MAHYTTEKFAKKLFGESEIEAIVERLGRLSQDEALMTVAQTLGVVHGLVGNLKAIMEGGQCLHDYWQIISETCFIRSWGINGKYSAGFGYVLRAEHVSPVLTWGHSRSSPRVT